MQKARAKFNAVLRTAAKYGRPIVSGGAQHRVAFAASLCLTACLCFAAEPTTRPALQQLSDDSRTLYDQVRHEVVRVETPMPQWMFEIAQRENPLLKWNHILDAEVRRQLASQPGTLAQPAMQTEISPANRNHSEPTSAPAMHVVIGPGAGRENAESTIPSVPIVHVTARVNTIGLIMDDHGHVLIPLYLEKEAAAKGPIVLYSPDGVCTAHFIGSDAKSNLTIVQMEKPLGRPATLDDHSLDVGSLVMILAPNQSVAQLVVWTGANPEYGIVSNMDGKIAGISRLGHLFPAQACQSMARQLIAGGSVKRALLGVGITEVGPDDPLRQSLPALGNRPAIIVKQVRPNSAAQHAGIRTGDLILQLAGQDIDDPISFATVIANRTGPTTLQILRAGKLIEKQVTLQPQ